MFYFYNTRTSVSNNTRVFLCLSIVKNVFFKRFFFVLHKFVIFFQICDAKLAMIILHFYYNNIELWTRIARNCIGKNSENFLNTIQKNSSKNIPYRYQKF